ncbi:Polyphosphate kinase 2 [Sulfurovum sp. enrichment culture clone C5]|uniref:ADP/GDP-polyphosphate phosphotransferase n=1 Tax=Sulfurovum sp. enrichment culture clone C5 TaxID=497650 RepID=A0A0S4XQW1_9BACT|nr:Polyphosphate kinase 2 [Sulfurovum sp. enrichment culture clone C5]
MEFEDFLQQFNADNIFKQKVFKKFSSALQEDSLEPYQVELIKLQNYLDKQNKKMIVLVEGRDASGKGGAIRRITRYMNEKHYRIVALGKPSDVQRTQWYFQRYVEQFPHGGEIVLFDRSWYNRAMVEPIFGFCTKEEYETFIKSVPIFEVDLINHGFFFVKIYFSVTKDMQNFRFQERETNPLKQWKLSEIDLQMQERWDDFTLMKYEMLKRTHTRKTPWTVIRSDDKFKARLNAIKTILNHVPYEDKNMDLDFTVDPLIVHDGRREIEIMEMDLAKQGKFVG